MPAVPVAVEIAQDEVLTGEAVALDVQPLGYFLRALGALIDVAVSVAVLVILWLTVGVWALSAFGPAIIQVIVVVSLVLVIVVAPATVETVTRGRSLGKLAVGGRIVRSDGGAIGFRHALIRALSAVLEIWLTVGAVAGVVGAFTPRAQRLGDLMAGTYSERTRAPKLPAPVGGVPPALAGWALVADASRLPDRTARRAAQFVRGAETLQPAARVRLAQSIARDLEPFVSPLPGGDAETFVRAVVAVRRDREFAALESRDARAAALTAGDDARGLPAR